MQQLSFQFWFSDFCKKDPQVPTSLLQSLNTAFATNDLEQKKILLETSFSMMFQMFVIQDMVLVASKHYDLELSHEGKIFYFAFVENKTVTSNFLPYFVEINFSIGSSVLDLINAIRQFFISNYPSKGVLN